MPEILVHDSFTAPNGTFLVNHLPEIGSNWVSSFGPNVLIYSNRVSYFDAPYNLIYNNVLANYQYVEAGYSLVDDSDSFVSLFLIYDGSSVYFIAFAGRYLPGVYKVQLFLGNLGNPLSAAVVIPQSGTMRLEKIGNTVNIYINGILQISVVSGVNVPSGYPALQGRAGYADNFSAYGALPAPVGKVDHLALMGVH